MGKLLAVTHNYIGQYSAKAWPVGEVERNGNVVIPIAGEQLQLTAGFPANRATPGERQEDEVNLRRREIIKVIFDERLFDQKPDALLVYIGVGDNGDVRRAFLFIENAMMKPNVRAIHLVWPRDTQRRSVLYRELGKLFAYGSSRADVFVHFADSPGSELMANLANEFLDNGFIHDPAYD